MSEAYEELMFDADDIDISHITQVRCSECYWKVELLLSIDLLNNSNVFFCFFLLKHFRFLQVVEIEMDDVEEIDLDDDDDDDVDEQVSVCSKIQFSCPCQY